MQSLPLISELEMKQEAEEMSFMSIQTQNSLGTSQMMTRSSTFLDNME